MAHDPAYTENSSTQEDREAEESSTHSLFADGCAMSAAYDLGDLRRIGSTDSSTWSSAWKFDMQVTPYIVLREGSSSTSGFLDYFLYKIIIEWSA